MKRFPIQGETVHRDRVTEYIAPISIPWIVGEIAWSVYDRENSNGQTCERIAERGGFGRDELLDLLSKADA